MSPTRILVIEDADALRKDVLEMLYYEGYEVFGASDGVKGVALARQSSPDLIICDIMMPEMDGYGVLAELREQGAATTVPFIFLTAKTEKSDIRVGMEAGADDYLTKPFTAQELIKSVKRRLEKRAAINQASEERLNELRDNIILSLPHELRTPLTGILGFSDILMSDCRDMEPDKLVEMAQYINNAAQRLYRLTENYVVYAQLEVMRSDPQRIEALRSFMTHNPRHLIENMAYQRAQHYRRESDLRLSVSDDAALRIVDENYRRLVDELLDNAFKFSLPGSLVEITGELVGENYVLTVVDHGRGMTRAQIDAVGAFMQFGRKLYEQQGSGFGLAIVHRTVELHGGQCLMESEPDQFMKVTVSIPAVPEYAMSYAY
ncbi:MAG: response regulator [Anaerolineae bacterium]|nr:response regulator [Anaerolineae bacterium]